MNIVTLELLAGPAPTQADAKEHARYGLRRARVMELHQQMLKAHYVRAARRSGLSNREIGEVLGHTEGWVRQYLKDTAGKSDPWDFADTGFRGHVDALHQIYKDLSLTTNMDHKLHVCAEYGLSDGAVASILSLNPDRVAEVMAGPRADAAS